MGTTSCVSLHKHTLRAESRRSVWLFESWTMCRLRGRAYIYVCVWRRGKSRNAMSDYLLINKYGKPPARLYLYAERWGDGSAYPSADVTAVVVVMVLVMVGAHLNACIFIYIYIFVCRLRYLHADQPTVGRQNGRSVCVCCVCCVDATRRRRHSDTDLFIIILCRVSVAECI